MKVIWLNLLRDREVIANFPSMPVKPASADVYDTSAEYSLERVSYGDGYSGYAYGGGPLLDGTSLNFEANKLTKVK